MSDTALFPSIAFQASLNVSALLFGVFGFLYAVYATYSSVATPEHPKRPQIVYSLRFICRIISALIILNWLVSLFSIIQMDIEGTGSIILAAALQITAIFIASISVWLSFWAME